MPSCSPLAPLTHHIRSMLAVFLLNFVFFPHGRRPYWRESLAFFPHKRSTGALGGQACLGWPRCLLVCGLALLQKGELLSFGPPTTYVQQTGFATRGPAAAAPYVGTAAPPKLSKRRWRSEGHAAQWTARRLWPPCHCNKTRWASKSFSNQASLFMMSGTKACFAPNTSSYQA